VFGAAGFARGVLPHGDGKVTASFALVSGERSRGRVGAWRCIRLSRRMGRLPAIKA
jgi:hypothetical protein